MILDEKFINIALKEAQKAYKEDEVPIGCVIVDENNVVIARAHNAREKKQSVFAHAEIEAIKKASKKIKDWQLCNCSIYVTLEPCIMCAGAILQSRFKKIVFGASDPKGGAFGGALNVLESKNLNVHPSIISGIMENECSAIIKDYFKEKRKKKHE